MTDHPALGPVALCTLIATDGQSVVDAYTQWLHQRACGQAPLDKDTADALGIPSLAGQPSWLLANTAGREWLQIVEHPGADRRDSLASFGWLAMEVLVEDVDQLADSLLDSPFELLREAADLDVSDKIRACQVRGPAGEVIYLTQVNGAVPPFELPSCAAPVDHLFIPVLSTPSRDQSLAQYSALSGTAGITFDTKITVVNQARGFELERRHPVATLQLAGQALIEIDEIEGTAGNPPGIACGMACVALYCAGSPPVGAGEHSGGPFAGKITSSHSGRAGEHFTLVYT